MDSVVIGVVAFAQSVALAKTFSIKNGYKIDANQVTCTADPRVYPNSTGEPG